MKYVVLCTVKIRCITNNAMSGRCVHITIYIPVYNSTSNMHKNSRHCIYNVNITKPFNIVENDLILQEHT